jgi:hypothetical protein
LKSIIRDFSLTADEWKAFAHRVFKSVDGLPYFDYDMALADTFPTVEDIKVGGVANLWELFGSTEGLPVAVVRGEHSDLLTSATVTGMKEMNAGMDATTVSNRGHAPFLDEIEATEAILRWRKVDAYERAVIRPAPRDPHPAFGHLLPCNWQEKR